MSEAQTVEVLIAGAGPAGLNAALILGRARRQVLVCDTARPRNAASWRVNGFLSRDGEKPDALREIGREQLARYESVTLREIGVTDARQVEGGFEAILSDGTRVVARKLLIATGLTDELPDIPGFRDNWGNGVYHCPYCDGYENRDVPMAIYGRGRRGMGFALELLCWSRDLVLCTDGPHELDSDQRERLARHGVRVETRRIETLEGDEDGLRAVRFRDGESLPRKALFVSPKERQACNLASQLGCEMTRKGTVKTRQYEMTNVPGLFVAGDASRRVQFAIVAAAEGAAAAFAINSELIDEDTV